MFIGVLCNNGLLSHNFINCSENLSLKKNTVFSDPALLDEISDLMLFGKNSKKTIFSYEKCIYLNFWRFTIKLLFNNIYFLIIMVILCLLEILDFFLEYSGAKTKEKILNNFIDEMIKDKPIENPAGNIFINFFPNLLNFVKHYLGKISIDIATNKEKCKYKQDKEDKIAKLKIIVSELEQEKDSIQQLGQKEEIQKQCLIINQKIEETKAEIRRINIIKIDEKDDSSDKLNKYKKFSFYMGLIQLGIVTSRIHNTFASQSANKTLQSILDESYVAAYENKEALFQSVYTLNKYLSQMGDACLVFLYIFFNVFHLIRAVLSYCGELYIAPNNFQLSFANNFNVTNYFFQIIISLFLLFRKSIYIYFIINIKVGDPKSVCEYPKSSYLEMFISMTHLLRNRQNYDNLEIVNYRPPSVRLFFILDTIATLSKIIVIIIIATLVCLSLEAYSDHSNRISYENQDIFTYKEYCIVLSILLIKKLAIEEILSIKEEDFLNILQAFIIISNIPLLDQRNRYVLPQGSKILSIELENTEIGFLKKNNFIKILNIDYLSIKTGKITGISGRSGGGKTTIFLLFLSEAAALGGKISIRLKFKDKIYKIPINKIKKKSLNEHLIVCRQNNKFDKNILIEKLIKELYPSIPQEIINKLLEIFCLDLSILKQHTGYRGVLLDQNTKNALGAILSFLEYLTYQNSTLFFDEHVDRIIYKNPNFFEQLRSLRILFYKKYKNINLNNKDLSIVIINHSKEVQSKCDEQILVKNGTATNVIGVLE